MATYQTPKVRNYIYKTEDFSYQPLLTAKLDLIGQTKAEITQPTINEIVLWKVSRYAQFNSELLEQLNNPIIFSPELDEPFTIKILELLLSTGGVRLPMASTILRFRNPRVYQIIDQRAYRMVNPGKVLKHSTNLAGQISLYLKYLEKLREICTENPNWKFEDMDRILYLMDKKHNSVMKEKASQD